MIAVPTSLPEFPSTAWFARLVEDVDRRPEVYQRLGFADCRFAIEIVDPPGPARCFGLVLDGYDIRSEGELEDVPAFAADVVLSGPLEVWSAMVAAIAAQGSADRTQTLNALSIAGFPLAARSSDPLGRDKFYRYAETLQTLFDSAGAWMETGAGAAAGAGAVAAPPAPGTTGDR
ncbi:MAG: hypothetical protein M0Z93_03200 [Actinomycetota bacterium]|nr:hypothetical protein [Actinomycetota bacterium]